MSLELESTFEYSLPPKFEISKVEDKEQKDTIARMIFDGIYRADPTSTDSLPLFKGFMSLVDMNKSVDFGVMKEGNKRNPFISLHPDNINNDKITFLISDNKLFFFRDIFESRKQIRPQRLDILRFSEIKSFIWETTNMIIDVRKDNIKNKKRIEEIRSIVKPVRNMRKTTKKR